MLFNSIEFAIFLPIVFALYWIIGSAFIYGTQAGFLNFANIEKIIASLCISCIYGAVKLKTKFLNK